MTYIDLTEKMIENHQEQMLKAGEKVAEVGYNENKKGQLIISKTQMFDQGANLIDKKSEIIVQGIIPGANTSAQCIDIKHKSSVSRQSSRMESTTAASYFSINSPAGSASPKLFTSRMKST